MCFVFWFPCCLGFLSLYLSATTKFDFSPFYLERREVEHRSIVSLVSAASVLRSWVPLLPLFWFLVAFICLVPRVILAYEELLVRELPLSKLAWCSSSVGSGI